MNSQVCVICHNKKTVNFTSNRLVVEGCGHVKCMDCLLHEKSGCVACIKDKNLKEDDNDSQENGSLPGEQDETLTVLPPTPTDTKSRSSSPEVHNVIKKKKPEISHIRTEQDGNGQYYVCTLCNKTFQSRSQVTYHAYCNGQKKPYECPECDKSFATQSHYKYHMRVHRDERTYRCADCGDAFFQMSKLQRHRLKHTKEKKHSCPTCNKAFSNASSLRQHSTTHSPERPYACALCPRRFRDPSNYRKHLGKHNPDKRACACSTCGQVSCPHRAAAPERAFRCARCPQAFLSNKDMRRHAAVHSDSKPFRCKVCNRRFRRKDNLERHIRNTHPNYVPSSAVECDESALRNDADADGNLTETHEKTRLEILNPLPPLPEEEIQKHMHSEEEKTNNAIDKSYIIEANTARQSVIVEKKAIVKREASPVQCEYVHKIRKANSMANQKDVPLPPIDEKKFLELENKTMKNNLDVGVPNPTQRMELYKKILYEGSEVDEDVKHNVSPEMHWRRKMQLNIN